MEGPLTTGKPSLGSATRALGMRRGYQEYGVDLAHELRDGRGVRTNFPVLKTRGPIAGLSLIAGEPAKVAQLARLILFA
jgi:hypothetical protein